MLSHTRWSSALILLLGACSKPVPPAQLSTTVVDSAGIPVITLDRPLADIALGKTGGANDTATLLFVVDSLTHPVAVAFMPSGETAILDRAEANVIIVDAAGGAARVIGQRGEGPGELDIPAGMIATRTGLVVLQSRASNVLVRLGMGPANDAVVPPIPGDWGGLRWQVPDIGLEFPRQSAPELWSRRIRSLDDSTFLVYVGPVNEDTAASARSYLLRFDHELRLRDTFAVLSAPHRELRPAQDSRGLPQLYQPIWTSRTIWTSGDGTVVSGRNDGAQLEVRGADGGLRQVIRWKAATLPVTEEDRMTLGEHVVRVTLATIPGATETAAKLGAAERRAMMDQFVGGLQFATDRPDFSALFLMDRCLWMAGFDAADEADGTAHEWLVVDLDHPAAAPRVVTIGGQYERVVAMGMGKAATIRLEADGFRRVRVYQVPACGTIA